MKKIIEAKALKGYRLWLRFADGYEGIADLSDLAGKGVFAAWDASCPFADVKVTEFGTVAWGDEIDLCPDALYLRVADKKPKIYFPRYAETTANR